SLQSGQDSSRRANSRPQRSGRSQQVAVPTQRPPNRAATVVPANPHADSTVRNHHASGASDPGCPRPVRAVARVLGSLLQRPAESSERPTEQVYAGGEAIRTGAPTSSRGKTNQGMW